MKKSFILFIALGLIVSGSLSAQDIEVPLRFDHYYDYEQLVDAMQALHQAYPDLTTLDLVGYSEEERAIYALTISNPKTGDHLSKPGVYVDGNIHGNEVQAGEVCLYLANRLLTLYGTNKQITSLVDKNSFYIIPAVKGLNLHYHLMTISSNAMGDKGEYFPGHCRRDHHADGQAK